MFCLRCLTPRTIRVWFSKASSWLEGLQWLCWRARLLAELIAGSNIVFSFVSFEIFTRPRPSPVVNGVYAGTVQGELHPITSS